MSTETRADIRDELARRLRAARDAARVLAYADTALKNAALAAVADALDARAAAVVAASEADARAAEAAGQTPALVDRLRLTPARVRALSAAVRDIIALPDPVGEVVSSTARPSGIAVRRVRVPLGVIGIVYEARPGVTIDAAALCIKSGNAVVLRGGREAAGTNALLGDIIAAGLAAAGLPAGAVQTLGTERAWVEGLLTAVGAVDVVIPRGGDALVRYVGETARVPVLFHAKGLCHVFVHAEADADKAERIVLNAKTQRPGVCNAAETLLLDAALPRPTALQLLNALTGAGVALRADAAVRAYYPAAAPAVPADFDTEYLALTMSVAQVDGLDGAAAWIAAHGSHHTEAIVSENAAVCERFAREIDASCVAVNASTRFNDGGELGLGAEMGISTSKLHAYGPMGLVELTTTKFVVRGDGHVRA